MSTRLRSLAILLTSFLLLAACAAPTQPTTSPQATALPQETSTGASTPATVEPSPTVAETSRVIVVAPKGQGEAVAAAVKDLASQSGLSVIESEGLAAGDLSPAVKVVVSTGAPENLDQLLQASPATQFVVISPSGLQNKAANLSVINQNAEDAAFLAGYLGALVSRDWRVAGLLPSDTPLGDALPEAFLNGARYWCGRCIPIEPPVALFPLSASLPAASDPAAWNAAVAELQKKVLDVVYIAPEATTPALLDSLAQQDFRLIGSIPPPPEIQSHWVATVGIDPAASLKTLWPDLLSGKGGQKLTARVAVSAVNDQWLTPGRQRLVNELLDQLEKGLISPKTVN